MINVFIDDLTPRIQYTFELIFETLLKSKVVYFTDLVEYIHAVGCKINYSNQTDLDGFYLKPQGLLHENILYQHEPEVIEWEGEKALYPVLNSFIPFDLFSATFYLVTRYEEYLPRKRDIHQRFIASESLASKNGFIEIPLINRWVLKLAQLIEQEFPDLKFTRSSFTYLPTIDIDNAWAFQNKGLVRTAYSILKDIVLGRLQLKKRLRVLAYIEKDPYDNYDFMFSTFKIYGFSPICFFLLNQLGKYDRSLSYKNMNFRRLVYKFSKIGKVGIHPSYASNKKEEILSKEIQRLKEITGNQVIRSRQHFLKMEMPFTYRKLISQGITSDYSMGYASHPGFRASIATPFNFFDVIDNCTTELKITPFQVMDVSLVQYQKHTPAEALKIITKLMDETALVGGTFVSLWHNESMSEEGRWKGWQNVYTEMTKKAFDISDGKND